VTTRCKLTEAQRLDRLVDGALKRAEDAQRAGEPPSAQELNGLRRLLDRRERDRELEEARRLTKG